MAAVAAILSAATFIDCAWVNSPGARFVPGISSAREAKVSAKTVDQIIDALIGREGGFVDHPSDRGGPTIWGVTEQVARAFGYRGGMREMPRSRAVEIYEERYWRASGLAAFSLIFPRAAEKLFDIAVNMGPAIAVKFLQRTLNLLNRRGNAWPDITVDGGLGAMTLDAARRYAASRGTAAETVLIRAVTGLQVARYAEITEARPANEDFFYGWILNRVGDLA